MEGSVSLCRIEHCHSCSNVHSTIVLYMLSLASFHLLLLLDYNGSARGIQIFWARVMSPHSTRRRWKHCWSLQRPLFHHLMYCHFSIVSWSSSRSHSHREHEQSMGLDKGWGSAESATIANVLVVPPAIILNLYLYCIQVHLPLLQPYVVIVAI